ncbi:tRNA1(Val) (adenine(37)-N6)-methyltransferase [Chryseolinea lacunae]|uniref:tRNA1(Val) (adenine(37)-N6)-methyltransferase n=1 Tax=Chryseolinea lacunae TaxID=2801331 RepID=A0ABS1KM58_9BACT|nr:methyltransferase [Chryseolinea lacunae]MBL0739762.1 methyltransferase [Chryseolinea lacunae]
MKRKTHFQFKQFVVQHDRCTMKIGTDAVLLGAWGNVTPATRGMIDLPSPVRILDIGTGSGVIAIMAAQRSSDQTQIDAVEIETQDALQATENFAASPWSARLHLHTTPIQDFSPGYQYDVIVSNPPYFINSQEPPDKRRLEARHTVSLDYDTLLTVVKRLLKPEGRFSVILPYTEGLQFMTLAQKAGMFCRRQCSFRTRLEKPIERWMLEFAWANGEVETDEVLLYDEGVHWSASYVALTKDFYLKM